TQSHPVVVTAAIDRFFDLFEDARGESLAAADHREDEVLPHDLRPLFDHVLFEQIHQKVELAAGALPVFAAEAIQLELADPQPRTLFDNEPNALNAASMPFGAREPAAFGPAAVAVHDDGNVLRQLLA